MSDILSPESATASCTAVSAWAASGISAERVTLEKPTPLTATLHRFSHMWPLPSVGWRRAREAKLRQGDVVVQLLEDDLDAPPDFRLGIGRFQQVACEQRTRRIVELDDDAGVGHGGREAFVAGMIHDGVGVDCTGPPYAIMAHSFEFQVRRDAFDAGRIRRVLEMSATLAALQVQNAPPGRIPEWLRPLVRNRDRPGYLTPVAHLFPFAISQMRRQGIRGSSVPTAGLTGFEAGDSGVAERLSSSSVTILRISGKPGGAVRPNWKIRPNESGWFQIAASTAYRMFEAGCLIAHSTSLVTSLPSSITSAVVSGRMG